ncbi:MAG: TolC family protein [Bacteroidales bacterium]|nr:TolC family protein [Bacteroidales bacterium]
MKLSRYTFTVICALFFGNILHAQSTNDLLDRVMSNNLTLKALENQVSARGYESMAAISLPDPEIEFALLAGSPSEIGIRKDISVTQGFDIATLSGARRNVVLGENELLKLQWKATRREIMSEARNLVAEIVCRNALIAEYARRTQLAEGMADALKGSLEKGAATVMDHNKAVLALSEARASLSAVEMERESLLRRLAALNGGTRVDVSAVNMDPEMIPEDFEEWFDEASESSSILAYVRQATELSKDKLSLARSESLPSMSVGYMAELVPGSNFRGVTMGISVPLWSSARRIRSARYEIQAAEAEAADAAASYRMEAESAYITAMGLKKIADDYAQVLFHCDNSVYAQKAYELGQISLLEYLVELDMYYDAVTRSIEADRDYQLALTTLRQIEM